MMETIQFDYEANPDGISESMGFDEQESLVWERGYYCEVEEGIWYELYVNDTIKESFPSISGDVNDENSVAYAMRGFKGLWIGDYEENNQITFFVPTGEETWTYGEMTDIFL